jgi:hypothetical protein
VLIPIGILPPPPGFGLFGCSSSRLSPISVLRLARPPKKQGRIGQHRLGGPSAYCALSSRGRPEYPDCGGFAGIGARSDEKPIEVRDKERGSCARYCGNVS